VQPLLSGFVPEERIMKEAREFEALVTEAKKAIDRVMSCMAVPADRNRDALRDIRDLVTSYLDALESDAEHDEA
jgi:hypothetical protein